jgi:transcriptional regulator with XRE-family HTH domain
MSTRARIAESFGDRLQKKRLELGLTQKELAALIGVTPGAITQYEGDLSSPSKERLEALGKTLRCSIDYLMSGHQASSPSNFARDKTEIEVLRIIRQAPVDSHPGILAALRAAARLVTRPARAS